MIELYGMSSPNVVKVIIMLEEVHLAYRLHHLDLMAGEQFDPGFRALNPNSKVPVLVDPEHGVTVFESGAILLYLAERTGILQPVTLIDRATVIQWLMLQMSGLGPMAGQAIHFTAITRGEAYAQARYVTELNRLLDVIDARLSASKFIAGAAYSIADIAVWPWIRTVSRYFESMPERQSISRWYSAVAERSAVGRAVELSDQLLVRDREQMGKATDDMRKRYYGRAAALSST